MRTVVVGGRGLPEQVAVVLRELGDEVALVDTEPGGGALAAEHGIHLVGGDPLVPATLERAGAARADVLVACTRSDEENLVVSLLAKRRFDVPRVLARVNDPVNAWMFDDAWGVDGTIDPAGILVSLIRQPVALSRRPAGAGTGALEDQLRA